MHFFRHATVASTTPPRRKPARRARSPIAPARKAAASLQRIEETRHEYPFDEGRHADLLQGLGHRASPWSSATAGPSARTAGKPRCSSWPPTATAASPTTVAATAVRASRGTATTWTPTPTTSRSSIETLDLNGVTLVGFSTGGGEVARYIGRHGTKRVARAALDRRRPAADAEDGGQSRRPADARRSTRSALGCLADRSQFYKDLASGPFFGANRPGAKVSQGMIDSFWLQGMQAGHKNTLRLHQGVLRDRLHRGPPEVRRADADPPRRRRPDRADRRLRPPLVEARPERDPEGLPGRAPRPRRHPQGPAQRRPAGVPDGT